MRDLMTFMPKRDSQEGATIMTLEQLYMLITSNGDIRTKCLNIKRMEGNPDEQNRLKRFLPIVLANGVFSQRNYGGLEEYSRYIIMDYDYELPKEQAERDRDLEMFRADRYARLVFLSPRGGIKILVEHNNTDSAHHAELYGAIGRYYNLPRFDACCKDIPRCHHISYDPNALMNLDSEVFDFTPTQRAESMPMRNNSTTTIGSMDSAKIKKKYGITTAPATPLKDAQIYEVIKEVYEWSKKSFPIAVGERNSNLFKFACVLHDKGVPHSAALQYLVTMFVTNSFTGAEIEKIVWSAYRY
ncbi:MAG: BT4734/BF3469 family protein [Rikenellaceae bacterium]